MLLDEGKHVARKAARQGVNVVWEQWEAMPHCFALILLWSPMSKRALRDWADFCKSVVEKGGEEIESKGLWFEAKTGREVDIDVREMEAVGDEEVRRRMAEAREARHLGKEGEAKMLPNFKL